MKRFVLLFDTRQTCTVLAARFEITEGVARFYDEKDGLVSAAPAQGLLVVSDEDHFENLTDLDMIDILPDDDMTDAWEN